MSLSEAILFAWEFDTHGGGRRLDATEMSASIKADRLSWVHLDATRSETREWLTKEVSYLDTIIIDALLEHFARAISLL